MTLATMAAGIPMYVHPGVDARSWAALTAADQPVSWIVLNQDNGPGAVEDGVLYDAARAVKAAGTTKVCGYINYEYGTRSGGDFTIFAEADTWVSRGIDCVFLDQAPSTADKVQSLALSVLGLRDKGMKYVVLNFGVLPHPSHLDTGDVAVVYEGDMATYRTLSVPEWLSDYQPERLAHLVYEADPGAAKEAVSLARGYGVHHVFATSGTFISGNPWAGIPLYWSAEAAMLKRFPLRPAPGWV